MKFETSVRTLVECYIVFFSVNFLFCLIYIIAALLLTSIVALLANCNDYCPILSEQYCSS